MQSFLVVLEAALLAEAGYILNLWLAGCRECAEKCDRRTCGRDQTAKGRTKWGLAVSHTHIQSHTYCCWDRQSVVRCAYQGAWKEAEDAFAASEAQQHAAESKVRRQQLSGV